MKFYKDFLTRNKFQVTYVEAQNEISDIRVLVPFLKKKNIAVIHFADPVDDWLYKRLKKAAQQNEIKLKKYESPMFINAENEIKTYFKNKDKLQQTSFYIQQRKRLAILLDRSGRPHGGKWTFDKKNRKKYPNDKTPPQVSFPAKNPFYKEAWQYTNARFKNNPGSNQTEFRYPVTFAESRTWLDQFLKNRFAEFGPYEDAMAGGARILHHSLLSPLLNTGLLTPREVIDKSINFFEEFDIPLNSAEGFIRQIIGWREFIRGVYLVKGRYQRTRNFWNFNKPLPDSFYTAATGIEPLDKVINKVIDTGYCHHIERLMVLGNFMLLCEFDPDAVYRWFMEMFIDAYDWVMVPNVYGMSQFADGGLTAGKPYISSSNYLLKMSDFRKGSWQKTWDALFWRFMHVHRDYFTQNPRLGMLVRTYDKMPSEKQNKLLGDAGHFLETILI